MASSNIKLFDENKGNMLSDSEFSISNQRMNGLQTGVASSQLQNKAMYQASLVAYAIAQIMMQNGLNANDTDAVSAFVANLSGTMLQKVYDLATTAEAQAGVATGKWMSPALVKAAIDTLAAKAQNILSDTTKTLYGLGSSAVPDDVFAKIAQKLSDMVSKSGDTIMTGALKISKDNVGMLRMWGNKFGAYFASDEVGVSQYQLYLNRKADPTIESNLINALYLAVSNDGVGWNEVYNVLHTGNASELGYKKLVKLWENASPESNVAGGNISLDLSQYTFVAVEVKNCGVILLRVGGALTCAATNMDYDAVHARWFQANTNNLGFTDGHVRSYLSIATMTISPPSIAPPTVDNSLCIPLCIYGIK